MRYEGPDVNRLISNGLLSAGAMFDKTKSAEAAVAPAPAPAPAPVAARTSVASQEVASRVEAPRAATTASVISHCVQLTGSIETPEELHIYGTIKGNVKASALVIWKGGMVKGEVVAETVQVHGSVEGSIQGKKVHLLADAVVRGDIFHDVLGVDPGALFEGASKRIPAMAAE